MSLVRRSGLVAAVVAALGARVEGGAQRSVLPFGLKAGHHAVRVETALWTPRDTGRFPVVIVAAGGPPELERAFPEYLASHGFTVVRAAATSVASLARRYGDSTPVAIVTWGRDTTATATVETGRAVLSIRALRPSDPPAGRLQVVLPGSGSRPGAEARAYRSLCAVAQAMLNAALKRVHPTLPELAERLRAAGVREAYIRAT